MKEPNRSREELKGKHPYGSHYDASTSPNAQNMRETDPRMPRMSDNARVDLSTDPLSGLDDQNDTGSCTGAEFGGYSRYSNGYKGNPQEVKSDKSAHRSQNAASAKKEEAAKSRRSAAGLCLALAVSAAALGAAAWLSDGGLTASPGTGSETAELSQPAASASDTPADASQPDVPKTENFVLDYAGPESTDTPAETPAPQPEASDAETAEAADTETAEAPAETAAEPSPEEAAAVDSEAVSTPATPDAFILPVDGAVTNPYSQGELVKSKTLGEWRTHDGIDFAAAEGTPVVSIADGLVEAVREDARWGNTVEVNYGDYTAFYYGLGDEIQVEAGQAVSAGQTIGEAGNSSLMEAEEAPHLHLGIKKGEDWVDPALLFGLDGAETPEPAPGASDTPESADPAAS